MSEYYAPVDYYGQEDREDDEEGLIIDEQAPTATTSQSNLAVNSGVSRKHLDPIVQEYYTGEYQEEEGEYPPEPQQKWEPESSEDVYQTKGYRKANDYADSSYHTRDYRRHSVRNEKHKAEDSTNRSRAETHSSAGYPHESSRHASSLPPLGQVTRIPVTKTAGKDSSTDTYYARGIASDTDPIVKMMGNMEEEEEGEVHDDDDDSQTPEELATQDDLWDDAIQVEGGEEDWSMLQGTTSLYLDDEDTVPIQAQGTTTAVTDDTTEKEAFNFWKRCKICLLTFRSKQDFLVHLHEDEHKNMLLLKKAANLPPALQQPLKPLKPLLPMTDANGKFLLRLPTKKSTIGFCPLCNANVGYGTKAQKQHLQGKRHNKMYLSEMSQYGPEYFFNTYGNVAFGDPTLKGNAEAWRSDREKTPFVVYAMRCGFFTSYECKVCRVQYRASWDWRYHLRTMEHIVKTRATIEKMGEEAYRRILFDVPSEIQEAYFGGMMESVFSSPLDIQQPLLLKTEMRFTLSGKIGESSDTRQVWMSSRQQYIELQQIQIKQEEEERRKKPEQEKAEHLIQEGQQHYNRVPQENFSLQYQRQIIRQDQPPQDIDNSKVWECLQKQWREKTQSAPQTGNPDTPSQNLPSQQLGRDGAGNDQQFKQHGQYDKWPQEDINSGRNYADASQQRFPQTMNDISQYHQQNIQDVQQKHEYMSQGNNTKHSQPPQPERETRNKEGGSISNKTDNRKSTLLADLTARIRQLMAETKKRDTPPHIKQSIMTEMMQLMEQQQQLMVETEEETKQPQSENFDRKIPKTSEREASQLQKVQDSYHVSQQQMTWNSSPEEDVWQHKRQQTEEERDNYAWRQTQANEFRGDPNHPHEHPGGRIDWPPRTGDDPSIDTGFETDKTPHPQREQQHEQRQRGLSYDERQPGLPHDDIQRQRELPYNERQRRPPHDERQRGLPHDERQRGLPHDERQRGLPHDERQRGLPHDERQRGLPYDERQRGLPHDERQRGLPHDERQPGLPHDNRQRGLPHDERQRGLPHDNRQHGLPHDERQRGLPHGDGQHGSPYEEGQRGLPHDERQRRLPYDEGQRGLPHDERPRRLPHGEGQHGLPYEKEQRGLPHDQRQREIACAEDQPPDQLQRGLPYNENQRALPHDQLQRGLPYDEHQSALQHGDFQTGLPHDNDQCMPYDDRHPRPPYDRRQGNPPHDHSQTRMPHIDPQPRPPFNKFQPHFPLEDNQPNLPHGDRQSRPPHLLNGPNLRQTRLQYEDRHSTMPRREDQPRPPSEHSEPKLPLKDDHRKPELPYEDRQLIHLQEGNQLVLPLDHQQPRLQDDKLIVPGVHNPTNFAQGDQLRRKHERQQPTLPHKPNEHKLPSVPHEQESRLPRDQPARLLRDNNQGSLPKELNQTRAPHGHISEEGDEFELHLKNIPLQMGRVELKKIMSNFGYVTKCKIRMKNAENTGSAFVKMDNFVSCDRVIAELDGKPLPGYKNIVDVRYAMPMFKIRQIKMKQEVKSSDIGDKDFRKPPENTQPSLPSDIKKAGTVDIVLKEEQKNTNVNRGSNDPKMRGERDSIERQPKPQWNEDMGHEHPQYREEREARAEWFDNKSHRNVRVDEAARNMHHPRGDDYYMDKLPPEHAINRPADMDMRNDMASNRPSEETLSRVGNANLQNLPPLQHKLLQKLGPEAFGKLRANPMARNLMNTLNDPDVIDTALDMLTQLNPEVMKKLQAVDTDKIKLMSDIDPSTSTSSDSSNAQGRRNTNKDGNNTVDKLLNQGIPIELLMHGKEQTHSKNPITASAQGRPTPDGIILQNEAIVESLENEDGLTFRSTQHMGDHQHFDTVRDMGRGGGIPRRGFPPRGMIRGGMPFRGRGFHPRPHFPPRQNFPLPRQNMPRPAYNMPLPAQNMPPSAQNMPPPNESMTSPVQNELPPRPSMSSSRPNMPPLKNNIPSLLDLNVPKTDANKVGPGKREYNQGSDAVNKDIHNNKRSKE